eukprot:COSAG05_NODE_5764_length_1093_cov_1.267606_1_plen_200_part_00
MVGSLEMGLVAEGLLEAPSDVGLELQRQIFAFHISKSLRAIEEYSILVLSCPVLAHDGKDETLRRLAGTPGNNPAAPLDLYSTKRRVYLLTVMLVFVKGKISTLCVTASNSHARIWAQRQLGSRQTNEGKAVKPHCLLSRRACPFRIYASRAVPPSGPRVTASRCSDLRDGRARELLQPQSTWSGLTSRAGRAARASNK